MARMLYRWDNGKFENEYPKKVREKLEQIEGKRQNKIRR